MSTAERYLRPNVIAQGAQLNLHAKFIVYGFLVRLRSSFSSWQSRGIRLTRWGGGQGIGGFGWVSGFTIRPKVAFPRSHSRGTP
jgi:hypothetical protein